MPELDHTPKFIALNDNQNAIICVHDCAKVVGYKWRAWWNETGKCYYAMGSSSRAKGKKSVHVSMARLVMNTPDDMIVDHMQHQTLDNRCTELRNTTYMVNNRNTKKAVAAYVSGKVLGVKQSKSGNRWTAKISNTNLGSFTTEAQAIAARRKAEDELGWNDHIVVV